MRILMVEDDMDLCRATALHLKKEGYDVDIANDGEEGLYYMTHGSYDLVLLDRMLPCLDGVDLLKKARKQGLSSPVLMLTALDGIRDRVSGLDAGADDYLSKPFDYRELFARIRALSRRPHDITGSSELSFADLLLDTSSLYLQGKKGRCGLSKKECDLLALFIQSGEKTLSRSNLFARIWGADAEVEEASLDSYIHFIRRRLRAVSSSVSLITVRGVGYRLEEQNND